mgnify:CR=1 FL=1
MMQYKAENVLQNFAAVCTKDRLYGRWFRMSTEYQGRSTGDRWAHNSKVAGSNPVPDNIFLKIAGRVLAIAQNPTYGT